LEESSVGKCVRKIFQSTLITFKFALIVFFITQANIAVALYDECIFSWEFGDTEREIVVVRPIGEICHDRCSTECLAFSRTGLGGELNQDRIDACYMACQSGISYQNTLRDPNPDETAIIPYVLTPTVTVPIYCSTIPTNPDSAYNNYYSSGLEAKNGEKVYITLANPPGFEGNVVYMCGKKTAKIYPNFIAYNSANWNSNSSSWSSLNYNINSWNAKNHHWTDTGIDAKDGDELVITYGWPAHYSCNGSTCSPDINDNNLLFRSPYTESWDAGSRWLIPGFDLWTIEADGSGNYSVTPDQADTHNENVTFLGLKGRTWKEKRKVSIDSLGSPIYTVRDDYQFRMQKFYGRLSGFSSKPSRIGIMHYDSGGSNNWNDNLGGTTVEISWKGCPQTGGEGLQYALVPSTSYDNAKNYDPTAPGVTWYDVPLDAIQNRSLLALQGPAEGGAIYFRIKPVVYSNALAPSCPPGELICHTSRNQVQLNFNTTHASGQYFVQVQKENIKGMISTFVSDIMNQIRTYLFGSGTTEGKVQKIFNMLVVDTAFIDAIRALLVLYIAYTGISFLIGMAQITQQEAAVRLTKVGVVITLISPDSWHFFNTYLFNLFTNGGLELIARVSAPVDAAEEYIALIESDPSLIFSMFDKPFAQLFAKEVWIKILALILSSFIGFFLAIVVILSAIIYAISIGKAILIYLISLVGISILLMVAPIFISCILFQYTRSLFDAWIKQLINFTLQPVLVFGILAILNNLLLIGLYTCLSFTACKICLLGFNLKPLFDICLIPAWTTMMDMHYPPQDFIGMPISLVGAVLFFLIIAQATYVMCDYCAQLAMILVSGFLGVNLASAAAQANPVTTTVGGFADIFGLDEGSRGIRANTVAQAKGYGKSVKADFMKAREKVSGAKDTKKE
jgi:type IV secretion system protein VirB6